ncbi:MAG: nucleoside hydrolase [Acidimicrobiia bacterium]|nr:nucleoside hydrolase [Acidimicrobiia bacterium]
MTIFPTVDADRRARMLAPPDPADGAVDVVLDTDVTNEIDDQFAIVWTMLRPDRVNLLALTACPYRFGPELVTGTALEADIDRRDLARRLGATVEGQRPGAELSEEVAARIRRVEPDEAVARAAAELTTIAELCGRTEVPIHEGSRSFLPGAGMAVASAAAEAIVELAHAQSDGRPLQVLAIGCATNVASALLLDPSIVDKVVVVWTSAYPTFWPYPNASYNLSLDLHASRILFASGVPLVYLPGYYVGEELRISRPEVEAWVRPHGPVGAYLADAFASHPKVTGVMRSKVIWDLVNVAWVVDPSLLTTVVAATPLLDDARRWVTQPAAPLLREAVDLDRDRVFADLVERLIIHAAGA